MAGAHDEELEAFKTGIDLRVYAASLGYEFIKNESWRGSSVMRRKSDDDKIIVKRDTDGHYVYFSVRDTADNGSVIDFVQRRMNFTLGAVRQELRPWTRRVAASLPSFPGLPVTRKNRFAVEASFRRMKDAARHSYLELERRIPAALLGSPRFAGRVRIDGYGNAIFPHFDQEGLCGYEIKNKNYTGFSSGGAKGLWFSHAEAADTRLVFCEGAIDALSHAALFPAPAARYASIGGQLNATQPELIRAALKRLKDGFEVVAAMDADGEGRKLSAMIAEAVAAVPERTLHFIPHEPSGFKDWNEAIKARDQSSFPTALPSADV